jgi:hypothetical protein
VDKLLALSSDSSSTIKSAAVAALAPVATQPRVKEVVLAAFSDSSLDVQMAAANTLAELIASEKVGPRVAGRPQVT